MHFKKLLDRLKDEMFQIDLQLFAMGKEDGDDDKDEDEFIEDEDSKEHNDDDSEEDEDKDEDDDSEEDHDDDDPEKDEKQEDEDDSDSEEEEEDEDDKEAKGKKNPDKVTKALIEAKRRAKEAERKLRELEEAQEAKEQTAANEKRIADLVKEGYGETQARMMVESDARAARLEVEIQKLKFEKLEKSYPGISDHMHEILKVQKQSNGALTIEEIYNAKFRKQSEYDIKTKAEAETLHRQKSAKQKKGSGSQGGKGDKPVTLSKSNERAYQYLIKQPRFRNMTRKQFLDLSDEE